MALLHLVQNVIMEPRLALDEHDENEGLTLRPDIF
jgi:hypothetical protein